MRSLGAVLILSVGAALAACTSAPGKDAVSEVREPTFAEYDFTDAAAWRPLEGGGLELFAKAGYEPPFRSPTGLALLRGEYGSFEMTLEAQSTGRQYGHRDLCFVFGYQDPAHYYYVHLAPAPDQHAHNAFLVDGAARRALLPVQAEGMEWDDEWHQLRVVRDVQAGTVEVYVDGGEEPVIALEDRTLGVGRVGLGSFDDTGRFRGVRVRVPEG